MMRFRIDNINFAYNLQCWQVNMSEGEGVDERNYVGAMGVKRNLRASDRRKKEINLSYFPKSLAHLQ